MLVKHLPLTFLVFKMGLTTVVAQPASTLKELRKVIKEWKIVMLFNFLV